MMIPPWFQRNSGLPYIIVILLGITLEAQFGFSESVNMDQYKFHMSKVLSLYTNGFNVHQLGTILVSMAYSFSPAEDRPVVEQCLGQHDNETVTARDPVGGMITEKITCVSNWQELIKCYMEKTNMMDSDKKCNLTKLKEFITVKMAAAPPIAVAVLQKYAECVCQISGAEGMICAQQKTMDYVRTLCSAIVGDE